MDKLNRWVTLTANVGVIAGLILVSIQVRQNTEISRAQIENDYFLADMQLELARRVSPSGRSKKPDGSWTPCWATIVRRDER